MDDLYFYQNGIAEIWWWVVRGNNLNKETDNKLALDYTPSQPFPIGSIVILIGVWFTTDALGLI